MFIESSLYIIRLSNIHFSIRFICNFIYSNHNNQPSHGITFDFTRLGFPVSIKFLFLHNYMKTIWVSYNYFVQKFYTPVISRKRNYRQQFILPSTSASAVIINLPYLNLVSSTIILPSLTSNPKASTIPLISLF